MLDNKYASTVTILNTSIITMHGSFTFEPLTLEGALNIMREQAACTQPVQSAIGHESTAQICSDLLGERLAVCREQYAQPVGARALVFKLRGRAPEGKILSREEVEQIGYDFGLLTRTA